MISRLGGAFAGHSPPDAVEAMVSVWGGNRLAVRLGTWNSMSDSNPAALFDYVADQLNRFGLAYLHLIEPRIKGNVLIERGLQPVAAAQLRQILKRKIIAASGFEPDRTLLNRLSKRETLTWLRSGVISLRIHTCRSVSNAASV